MERSSEVIVHVDLLVSILRSEWSIGGIRLTSIVKMEFTIFSSYLVYLVFRYIYINYFVNEKEDHSRWDYTFNYNRLRGMFCDATNQ